VELNPSAIIGIGLIGATTFYLGFHSSRLANTTPDFLVARRIVRSRRNAAAITGEYLSAASFLGIAGLILKDGVDSLWYAVGFTAGYLALLLFVAAPLRRSGAYTLPDFAEARLGSTALRRLCTVFVVVISVLYLVPQLQGAGLTLSTIMPVPPWVGMVLVIVLVTVNAFGGGMRSITVVQAFQYWVKLVALALPAFVLVVVFVGGHPPDSLSSNAPPVFPRTTTVAVPATVELQVAAPVRVQAFGTVNDFPANALFYVRDSGRLYRLKKNMAIAIVQDTSGMANVINGLGSSAAAGRFVAIRQMGIGTLVAGEGSATVVIAGWDVNPDGWFHVTHTSFGGTPGFLRAFASNETEVTVDSSDADSGGVFVTYYQTPGGE